MNQQTEERFIIVDGRGEIEQPKPNYYAIITADVRYDKELPMGARLLYGEISALTEKEGYCWAENKYFAECYEVSDRTISDWISNLAKKGYITVKIWKNENFGTKRRIYLGGARENLRTGTKKSSTPYEENFASISTTISNTTKPISVDKSTGIGGEEKSTTKTKKRDDSGDPMSLLEFVEWLRSSSQRHMNLIAEYAEERKVKFTTKGQWNQFIKRNLRAATALAPYTDEQISSAMGKLEKELERKDFKWTLETVSKYLE